MATVTEVVAVEEETLAEGVDMTTIALSLDTIDTSQEIAATMMVPLMTVTDKDHLQVIEVSTAQEGTEWDLVMFKEIISLAMMIMTITGTMIIVETSNKDSTNLHNRDSTLDLLLRMMREATMSLHLPTTT